MTFKQIIRLLILLIFFALNPQAIFAQLDIATYRADQTLRGTYKSIQEAVDAAQPGDTILLSEGIYHENILIQEKSGVPSQPITLAGKPGHRVVIDGAVKALQHPNQAWQPAFGIANNTYVLDFPYDLEYDSAKTPRFFVTASRQDEALLWTYSKKSYLREFWSGPGLHIDFNNKKLYLRLENGENPNETRLNISSAVAVIYMKDSHHWKFENLELKHGGFALMFVRGADIQGIQVDGVKMTTAINGFALWGTGRNIVLKNSDFYLGWNRAWWWDNIKLIRPKTMEGSGVSGSFQESEIDNNHIEGFFNGILLDGKQITVHHNVIHNIPDDALEPETRKRDNVNIVFHNNLVYDAAVAVSLASSVGGPVYFYRNILVSDRPTIFNSEKIATGGTAIKHGTSDNHIFYHNTFYTTRHLFQLVSANGGKPLMQFKWYNNIFYNAEQPITVRDSGYRTNGNVFVRNLAYSPVQRPNKSISFGGLWGDPKFIETIRSVPDMSLATHSPARDVGDLTPLVEGWPGMERVTDGMPDIGAIEIIDAPQAPGDYVVECQPQSSEDDAEERLDTRNTYINHTTLHLAQRDGHTQLSGFRCPALDVPSGVIVTEAYVKIWSTNSNTGPMTVTVYGEATDNAAPFIACQDGCANMANRSRTDSTLLALSVPNFSDGTVYTSPDIAVIIQEIIDRLGWVRGNALALIATGLDGERSIYAYDGDPAKAPLLYIKYHVD